MFTKNFWIISVVVKLVLFALLTYFARNVRKSVDKADANGIKTNFKNVEILTYIIVVVNYILFLMKTEDSDKGHKRLHYSSNSHCNMAHVNLSLVLVLLACVWQTRSALNVAEKSPVPISFLDTSFQLTENMAYILLGFNTLTSGISLFFEHRDKFDMLSPRSHSRSKN